MNRPEITKLLTVIASYDNRKLDEDTVTAWHGVLGDLLLPECRAAVLAHYATATTWLMPAHIRARAIAARQDAVMRELPADRDDLVPMPEWFHERVGQSRERQHAINTGNDEAGRPRAYGDAIVKDVDRTSRRWTA